MVNSRTIKTGSNWSRGARSATRHSAHPVGPVKYTAGHVDDALRLQGLPGWGNASDPLGASLSTISTVGNIGWAGLEMGLPLFMYGAGGTMAVAGKSASILGADTAGQKILHRKTQLQAAVEQTISKKELGASRFAVIANIADSIVSPFYALSSRLNNATGLFSGRAIASEQKAMLHASKAAGHAQAVAPHVHSDISTAMSNMLAAAHSGDSHLVEQHSASLREFMGLHGVSNGIAADINKAINFANKQLGALGNAEGWKELATGNHNTKLKASQTSLQNGLAQSLFAVGSTAETISMVRSTKSDLDAFRNLIADIKGVDVQDVTSGDVLFGDLPHVGNLARRAFLTTAAPRTVLEVINQTFNVRMIMGKHPNLLLMFAPMLASSGLDKLTAGNILDVYKDMKQQEARGDEIDTDEYAKLIGLAHKGLHSRGGDTSRFAKEIGRIYAAKHVSIRQTLADAQNGTIDQLIYHIQHENAQEDQVVSAEETLSRVNGDKAQEIPSPAMKQLDTIQPNAMHKETILKTEMAGTSPEEDSIPQGFARRITPQPENFNEAVR